MMIAITATDSTIFPHASPEAKGTEPIAACTVAFGRYAITQKARSFHERLVFATNVDMLETFHYLRLILENLYLLVQNAEILMIQKWTSPLEFADILEK